MLEQLPTEHQALLRFIAQETFSRLPPRTKDEILAAAVNQYYRNIGMAVRNYGVETDNLHVSLEDKFIVIDGMLRIDYDKVSELILKGKSNQILALKKILFKILKEENRDAVFAGILNKKDFVVLVWKKLFNPYILKIDSIEAQVQ